MHEVVLWPLHNGVLDVVGYDVLPHFQAPSPTREDAAIPDEWDGHLRAIDTTAELHFHPPDGFDAEAGWTLKPGIEGHTVGQPGGG